MYWGDYLRDTGHLSAAEHGAYLLLIGHYWTSGKPLPDNDAQLARISRMQPKEWKIARPTVALFFSIDGVVWTHKRVEVELEKWERLINGKSNAGKASAAARAATKVQQDVNTCSTDVATGGSTDPPTKFNPSPSPSPDTSLRSDGPAPVEDEVVVKRELWTEGREFLRNHTSLDVRSIGEFIGRCLKLSGGDVVATHEVFRRGATRWREGINRGDPRSWIMAEFHPAAPFEPRGPPEPENLDDAISRTVKALTRASA